MFDRFNNRYDTFDIDSYYPNYEDEPFVRIEQELLAQPERCSSINYLAGPPPTPQFLEKMRQAAQTPKPEPAPAPLPAPPKRKKEINIEMVENVIIFMFFMLIIAILLCVRAAHDIYTRLNILESALKKG